MKNQNETTAVETGGLPPAATEKRPLPFDVRLRSLKSSRQTLARIVRGWARGEITEAAAKTGTWLMSMYLGFLKEATSEELETRLKALEGKLESIEKGVPREISRIS